MNLTKDNTASEDRVGTGQAAINRILATEETLIPSSGFLASVMERVQEEAAAPPPIPFPWKRAIPGMVLVTGTLGWGAFEFVRHAISDVHQLAFTPPHISATLVAPLEEAAWIALALGVSLVSWLVSRRLAGRSGLL
jgi:hypothetical protein